MNEKINKFRMHLHGFSPKMNLWLGHGVSLQYLERACVWKVSKGMYAEKEVVSYQDIFDYIANPPIKITSKVKY